MNGASARHQLRYLRASGNHNATLLSPLRRRSAVALVMLALIGALAATLSACAASSAQPVASGKTAPTGSPASASLRMTPLGDGLWCATQVAWSPDSTRVAVVGNGVNCSGAASGRTPGLILIYAAASGKLVQRLHPDAAVLALPTIAQRVAANAAAGGTVSTLTYQSLTWTPDSQALLVTFDLELQPNPNAGSTGVFGLQRLGASDSSLTKVWLDTSVSPFARFERWNLVSGAADTPPAPARAASYQWKADGTLAPAGSAVGQPAGAPDGGTSFTVWQPGQLQFGSKPDKATGSITVIPQEIGWVSSSSPVSPDGRYFYPNIINAGPLVPPSAPNSVAGEPIVQPHDQALVALAQQMMRTPSPSQNTSVLVSWRPDGRLMAALTVNATAPVSASAFTVSLYDTATGKLVKRLTPDVSGLQSGPAGIEALAWSPDGDRLLLMDNVYGAITVWGSSALPA